MSISKVGIKSFDQSKNYVAGTSNSTSNSNNTSNSTYSIRTSNSTSNSTYSNRTSNSTSNRGFNKVMEVWKMYNDNDETEKIHSIMIPEINALH